MASIRNLKKQINELSEDLKDECLVYLAVHPDVPAKKMTDMIREIDGITTALLFHINHWNYRPDGLTARQFIDLSIADAEKKLNGLLDKMRIITK